MKRKREEDNSFDIHDFCKSLDEQVENPEQAQSLISQLTDENIRSIFDDFTPIIELYSRHFDPAGQNSNTNTIFEMLAERILTVCYENDVANYFRDYIEPTDDDTQEKLFFLCFFFGKKLTLNDSLENTLDKLGETKINSLLSWKSRYNFYGHQSKLFRLFTAATPQDILTQLWNKVSNKVDIHHLRAGPTIGPYQGTTALWWLTAKSTLYPQLFTHIITPLLPELTIDDLRATPTTSPEQGTTLLWMLTRHSSLYPQLFTEIITPLLPELSLDDLRAAPTRGPNQGTTLLWMLTSRLHLYPQLFTDIITPRLPQLTIDDLRATPTTGPYQGTTALWWLTCSSILPPQLFTDIITPHLQQLTIDDLRVAPTTGPSQGTTALWWLTTKSKLYPQLFTDIITPHLQQLTMDDLRAAPTRGPNQGTTLLWILIFSSDGNLQRIVNTIMSILIKDRLNHHDLNLSVESNRISLMNLICQKASRPELTNSYLNPFLELLKQILKHHQGPIDIENNPDITINLQRLETEGIEILKTVNTCNAFYTEYNKLKDLLELSKTSETPVALEELNPQFENLKRLAQRATEVGHYETYFDLAKLASDYISLHSGLINVAFECCSNVPKESIYYTLSIDQCFHITYDALSEFITDPPSFENAEDAFKNRSEAAVFFALKRNCVQDNISAEYLNMVAKTYIKYKKKNQPAISHFNEEDINDIVDTQTHLFSHLNIDTPFDTALKIFDTIIQIASMQAQLKTQNIEQPAAQQTYLPSAGSPRRSDATAGRSEQHILALPKSGSR